ncbi:MAG TPA: tetratricopeptide repeat protein, partial [Isosphaeraceae bacterium]|nr:tetratricopeptide repeat protein [Isosphaeraceae bacterium]
MRSRLDVFSVVLCLLAAGSTCRAQSHGGSGRGSPGTISVPAAVGGGWAYWMPPLVLPPPPIVVVAPSGYFPAGPAVPPSMVERGLSGMPPLLPKVRNAAWRPSEPKRALPAQGNEPPPRLKTLITVGDRLFRKGNLHRAAERYEQALQAEPGSAWPRLRLAQVELVRGRYTEAANRYREAQAADPNWMAHAPDIQAIYAEPADFAGPIKKLETHLQLDPADRDGWLVLGAQWFL